MPSKESDEFMKIGETVRKGIPESHGSMSSFFDFVSFCELDIPDDGYGLKSREYPDSGYGIGFICRTTDPYIG